MPVVVHAEFEEVAQKAAGLRNSECEGVFDLRRALPAGGRDHWIGRPVAVGVLIAQKRNEVAGRSKASAEHRGPSRLIPEVVNLVGRKMGAGRKQSDRLPVYKLPSPRADFSMTVALAIAHRQTCIGLVGGDGRVVQPHDISLAGGAGTNVELVTDAAHHRLVVFE